MKWSQFKKTCRGVGNRTPYHRAFLQPNRERGPKKKTGAAVYVRRTAFVGACAVAAVAFFAIGNLQYHQENPVSPGSTGSSSYTGVTHATVPADNMPLTAAGVSEMYGYGTGELKEGVPTGDAAASLSEWYTLETEGVSLLAPVDRYIYGEVGADVTHTLSLSALQHASQALFGEQSPDFQGGTPGESGRSSVCQMVTPRETYQLYRYPEYPTVLFAVREGERKPGNIYYFVESEHRDGDVLVTQVTTVRICETIVDSRISAAGKTQATTAGYSLPWDTDSYEVKQEKLDKLVEAFRRGQLDYLQKYITVSGPVEYRFEKSEDGTVAMTDRGMHGTGDDTELPAFCATEE